MPATYVEGTEYSFGVAAASYAKPSVVTGDYLIIFIDRRAEPSGSPTPTPPSGWATAYVVPWFAYTVLGCFYRKVDGTEGAGPYVVGGTCDYAQFGSIGTISGADGTTFLHDSDASQGTGTSATTGAVIDGADANGLTLFQVATDGGATTGDPTAQFSGTVSQLFSLDSGDSELWLEQGWTAGATGRTYSISWSGSLTFLYGCITIKGFTVVPPATPVYVYPSWRKV